uniref:Putative secreted protein n=1 Tax=Anopheles triannulatus TaxID=58253 RepID=A0A2M4B707_9DIPT
MATFCSVSRVSMNRLSLSTWYFLIAAPPLIHATSYPLPVAGPAIADEPPAAPAAVVEALAVPTPFRGPSPPPPLLRLMLVLE